MKLVHVTCILYTCVHVYIQLSVVGPARHDDDDDNNIIRRIRTTRHERIAYYTRAHIYPRTRTPGERFSREFPQAWAASATATADAAAVAMNKSIRQHAHTATPSVAQLAPLYYITEPRVYNTLPPSPHAVTDVAAADSSLSVRRRILYYYCDELRITNALLLSSSSREPI